MTRQPLGLPAEQNNSTPQMCNICGETLIVDFPEVLDPITRETFAIHRCAGCGLGHTVPMPEDLSRYYGAIYYGNRHSFTARYCIKRHMRFVAAATGETTGKKMLDVGCGDGSFLLAAKEAGWEVVGTEFNPSMARAVGLDVRESVEQLSSDEPFDCITMWHSLEHITDVRSTLLQIAKLLKPNGTLLIAVPDYGGLQARCFRHRWFHLDVPRHLYHFDADSLCSSLEGAGFSVRHQWHQELEYDLLGWSQSALNCFLPVPNVFFDCLTGKRKNHGILLNVTSFLLGSLLTAISLPALLVGTLCRRGGVLVAVAHRSKPVE